MSRLAERAEPYLILGALWLLVFSVASQAMILAPILPRIAEQLGVPEARLASLVTGYSVAVAVVALLAGPVSDRVGRRPMLLAGAGAMAVGLALHALPGGYLALLGVRTLTGAAGGVLTGAAGAYVGDYFPQERRGWANGWLVSGMAAGQIVGIPLGTLMAAGLGFRAPFLFYAASMALAFGMVWRFVPQPPVRRESEPLGAREAVRHYARLLRRPRVGVAVLVFFWIFLATELYLLYLPTWLEGARGASPAQIALLFAVGGVATAIAGPPAGRLSDRVGRRRVVAAASVGVGVGMLATPWAIVGLGVAYPLFFAMMALVATRAGPFQALLAEMVPDEQRGSMMSLSMAAGQGGFGVGSAVAGPSYAALGYAGNAVMAAASSLVIALLVWRFLPEAGGGRAATPSPSPPDPPEGRADLPAPGGQVILPPETSENV